MPPLRVLAVLLCLSLSACIIHISGDGGDDWNGHESYRLRGSGTRATQTRTPGDFQRLKVALGGELHLVAGEATRVEISGDDNLLEHVRTRVVDGELTIDSDGEPLRFREGLRIELRTPGLRAVTLAGSASMRLENLSGEQFDACLAGSGEIVARGKVARATLSISGSGELRCRDLAADEVQLSLSGSGNAHVQAQKRLAISISGSGDVRYSGAPAEITRSIAGSGTIAPE